MPTSEQVYEFWKMGDVNLDGVIDSKDLDTIANCITSGTYDPSADINQDGVVNNADLQIATSNLGKNIWDYFGIQKPLDLPTTLLIGFTVFAGIGLVAYALTRKRRPKRP